MQHAFSAEYQRTSLGRKPVGITSAMLNKGTIDTMSGCADNSWLRSDVNGIGPRIFVSVADGSPTMPSSCCDKNAIYNKDTLDPWAVLNNTQGSAASSLPVLDVTTCLAPDMHPTSSFDFSAIPEHAETNPKPLPFKSPFIGTVSKNHRQRSSIGPLRRQQKTMSAPVVPRQTNSPIQTSGEKSNQPGMDRDTVSWDPHIDTFDLLRAKITGITRAMQDFHVHELIQDEMAHRHLKRERHHTTIGYHFPVYHPADLFDHPTHQSHSPSQLRPSMYPPSPTPDSSPHKCIDDICDYSDEEGDGSRYGGNQSDTDALYDHDHHTHDLGHGNDPELDSLVCPTSPNRNTLFATTNALIHSRFEELSETTSIASSCDLDHASFDTTVDTITETTWRSQFLTLVSSCIAQSEELESISIEMLGAELRVRELTMLNDTMNEQFNEREKAYEERLRECQDVEKQQLLMIDTLNELLEDLDLKLEQLTRRKPDATKKPGAKGTTVVRKSKKEPEQEEKDPWSFARAVADIFNMNFKDDMVHRLRWEIGMLVGGGVGTGHVIHTFEGQLHGIEMIIAGSGTTTVEQDQDMPKQQDKSFQQSHSVTMTQVSPSIQYATFCRHQYLLHLRPKDRQTQFRMLYRAHWVPDQMVDQCQFEGAQRCTLRFSFFQRRHHCRRCGKVVCQFHSGNRLPLFRTALSPPEWSRVCDRCFCMLISTQD